MTASISLLQLWHDARKIEQQQSDQKLAQPVGERINLKKLWLEARKIEQQQSAQQPQQTVRRNVRPSHSAPANRIRLGRTYRLVKKNENPQPAASQVPAPNFVTSTLLLSVTQNIQTQLDTLASKINDVTQRLNAASAENQALRQSLQNVKDGLIKLNQDQQSQLETLKRIQATQNITQQDITDLTARVASVNSGIQTLLSSIGL